MKKYEEIEAWILKGIREKQFAPGAKLPSENELCEQFGVSRNAVRAALSKLIHEGWVRSVKGVGTFCQPRVAPGALSTNIGFVEFLVDSYIFPELIRGCDHVLYKRGFHLLLNQSEFKLEKEKAIIQNLRRKKVDGIIIAPVYEEGGESNAELLEEIQNEGIAVVLCDSVFPGRPFSSVSLDDRAGGAEAAAYLWRIGHRKIGIFYQENYRVKVERMKGAADFLERQGAPVRKEWLVGFRNQGVVGEGPGMAAKFFREAAELPTAFICSNDVDALDFIGEAEKKGIRVPDDLSVVGFDNSSIAQLKRVSLSSVDHPSFSMGELMATLMLDKIDHPELRLLTQTVIKPSVVERDSVKPIAGALSAAVLQ